MITQVEQSVERLGIVVQLIAGARDLSFVRSVQTSSGAQVSQSPVQWLQGEVSAVKADGAGAHRSFHTFC
jgi:hypothetical protein